MCDKNKTAPNFDGWHYQDRMPADEPMSPASMSTGSIGNSAPPVFRGERARESLDVAQRIRVAIEGVDLNLAAKALDRVKEQVADQYPHLR